MLSAFAIGIAIFAFPQAPGGASNQQQPPATMFKQIITAPTGKNGYEEMVMAADVLRSGRYGLYDAYARNMPESTEKLSPDQIAVYNDLKGKTLLQRYRKVVQRFGKVAELLSQAAKKDIYDPRTSVDFATLFPELANFKDIARFVSIDAYCLFADGQSGLATKLLTTALEVFDRVGRGVLIEHLVAVASESILMPVIEERLPQLSQKDADLIDRTMQEVLARDPAIHETMAIEFKFTLAGLDKAFSDVKSATDLVGLFDDSARESVQATLKAMGPADLERVKSGSKARLIETGKEMVKLFSQPESAWAAYRTLDVPPPDWKSTEGIIGGVADAITPVFEQAGRAAAVSRTRLRILGLAGSVLSARWENNQLPSRLVDVVGEERAMDPLSQLPFELKRDGLGGFSIISKGTKETGEIGLRYKRPPGDSSPPPL